MTGHAPHGDTATEEVTMEAVCDCQPGYPGAPTMDHSRSCPKGDAESDRLRFAQWAGEDEADPDTGVVPEGAAGTHYPNLHAAAIDWCFPPGESYDDAWLERVFGLREYVLAQPCECGPSTEHSGYPDDGFCRRCELLNAHGAGR